MISSPHATAIGYHGCERQIGLDIVAGNKKIIFSKNDYDWLGNGAYFWENNLDRAKQWANQQKKQGKISEPFVIGAVISLGHCLDLMSGDYLRLLSEQFKIVKDYFDRTNKILPQNNTPSRSGEMLLRPLDCMVIESLHALNSKQGTPEFSTVRGVFFEGGPLFPGSSFTKQNHIQVCVRNHESILGYFIPQ
jgi:hypothetical protein